MPIDLTIMLLCLVAGIVASAFTYSLLPIVGVTVSITAVLILRVRQKSKERAVDASRNGFKKRAHSSGAVYVAESRSAGWMKIGYTSKSAMEREKALNQHAEGGQSDWIIKVFKKHWKAGHLENLAHSKLKELKIPSKEIAERKYKKTGRGSREIFQLDVSSAEKALNSSHKKINLEYVIKTVLVAACIILPILIAIIISQL